MMYREWKKRTNEDEFIFKFSLIPGKQQDQNGW
jgi:hypothetical protein